MRTGNDEIWEEVPGFEGLYEVSNLGHVWSVKRVVLMRNGVRRKCGGRYIAPSPDKDGNLRVTLSGAGTIVNRSVSTLVAMLFVPGYRPGLVAMHVNGDRGDNRADNLVWMSRSYALTRSETCPGRGSGLSCRASRT